MRVRHEAYGCNEREFHSPFQVGDVPLERSGQERFPDGERAAPKRSGEMRTRPSRRQAWQSDNMVSPDKLGFDLRERLPLPHNILARMELAAHPEVGQPAGTCTAEVVHSAYTTQRMRRATWITAPPQGIPQRAGLVVW
jgi:hypothetical protein